MAPYSPCWTADNFAGTCVPIDQCRRVKWMLTAFHDPYPQHIINYLRTSHCGLYDNKPHTCCANYDINQVIAPVQSPTLSPNPQNNNQHYQSYPQPTITAIPNSEENIGATILNRTPCGQFNHQRISNGESVELSEYPWMALLEYDNQKHHRKRFACSGSLITDRYVLTAAHCVIEEHKRKVIGVRLGEHDLDRHQDCEMHKGTDTLYCAPPVVDVGVEEIIRHPQFQTHPLNNDIALIRLSEVVLFQVHIKAICLPLASDNVVPTWLTIAGWGLTERGYASDILLKTNIPLQYSEVCQKAYGNNVQMGPSLICAGALNEQGTCRGDSGGPLFGVKNIGHADVRYIQYGIISAGAARCGDIANLPGVFIRVTSYIDWITANIHL